MTPITLPALAAIAPLLAVGLFVGMLVLLEVGRRLGARRLSRDVDGGRAGAGAVEGAVFALPAASQPAMRDLFRRYLDSRLDTYRKLPDVTAALAELTRSNDLQSQIWIFAAACTDTPSPFSGIGRWFATHCLSEASQEISRL